MNRLAYESKRDKIGKKMGTLNCLSVNNFVADCR